MHDIYLEPFIAAGKSNCHIFAACFDSHVGQATQRIQIGQISPQIFGHVNGHKCLILESKNAFGDHKLQHKLVKYRCPLIIRLFPGEGQRQDVVRASVQAAQLAGD